MGKQRKVVLSPGWFPRGCKGEGKGEDFINDLGFILLEISRGQGNLESFLFVKLHHLNCWVLCLGFDGSFITTKKCLWRVIFRDRCGLKKQQRMQCGGWSMELGNQPPASRSRFCPAHIWDKLLATAVAWLALLSGRFFCLTHPLGFD